jgi:competence protein ComEC
VAALMLALAARVGGPAALGNGRLALVFADVGQGDATLIRTPAGHWIVVDAGPADERWDAGERVVLPLLRRLGARRIEALVLSHAHRDHVGGAAALTRAMPMGIALEPGEAFVESTYHAWLETVANRGVRWRPVSAGDEWSLDGVRFRVLHPPAQWPNAGDDLNEDSTILEVSWGDFRALLMGDAGVVAEAALAGRFGRADLLKVGHHGSRTASSDAFLAEVRPQVAMISVGRNNYGHPTQEALSRLRAAGARIWRTDREGHITVESDGHQFTVRGASAPATYRAGRRAVPRRRRAPQHHGHHARALHSRLRTRPPRCHG